MAKGKVQDRVIKFRARDTKTGAWYYGSSAIPERLGSALQLSTFWHWLEHGGLDPDTLGQYTGLKDSKGVEIFEGDIVKGFDEDGDNLGAWEVAYCADRGYPAFDLNGHDGVDCNTLSYYEAIGSLEVIGNIYSNPELLEG